MKSERVLERLFSRFTVVPEERTKEFARVLGISEHRLRNALQIGLVEGRVKMAEFSGRRYFRPAKRRRRKC